MTKAPSSLQELRRRIYRKAKSETTVLQASTARVSGTSSPRDGRSFLRRCGKTLSQAGINPYQTAR